MDNQVDAHPDQNGEWRRSPEIAGAALNLPTSSDSIKLVETVP